MLSLTALRHTIRASPSLSLFSRAPSTILRPNPRPFSTSRPSLVHPTPERALRTTYFQRPGGGGYSSGGRGGGRRGNSFFDWLNRMDERKILYGIMGANVAVFLGWQYAISSYQRFRDPHLLLWMQRNFLVSWENLKQGRLWTLVTSAFSHSDLGHLGINLLGLYFMAPPVLSILGAPGFLGLYFGGSLVASATSLIWHRATGMRGASQGASGAIYAVMSFFAATYPNATFLVFFVIPAPAWACVAGIAGWDLWQTLNNRGSAVDTAGHLGGIAAGIWFAMTRGRAPRVPWR